MVEIDFIFRYKHGILRVAHDKDGASPWNLALQRGLDWKSTASGLENCLAVTTLINPSIHLPACLGGST